MQFSVDIGFSGYRLHYGQASAGAGISSLSLQFQQLEWQTWLITVSVGQAISWTINVVQDISISCNMMESVQFAFSVSIGCIEM